MVQFKLLEKAPPACTQESHIPLLERFFHELFIPSAVEMLTNEVRVGLPNGRIVHTIGPEHRFLISKLLINNFLEEYRTLVNGYLKRDFSQNEMFRLLVVKLIVSATRHMLFYRLVPVL